MKFVSLKTFGLIEGLSMVVLLFVAMPMKYVWDQPQMVRVVGMAHGFLFMIFVAWVLLEAFRSKWTLEKTAGALAASVIPFAPFVVDLSSGAAEREKAPALAAD
ncbi:DUF3817 domain-containing protein [Lujinxingia sediminis]|uniref:DUF3817 domain-containing protein n=1 Tax=Lujinxingia sediminis TaxID=2480984 RepID=A0ABY0CN70_9DELT|nr:DUF3817 domain-containing protein [Lujinxingia sediminis]RVU41407.1 DUF3817 domain-containing protein [Lujinxingia sediminis]